MTRRILAKTPTGDATKFGGEDTDYINQLLTGTDQGASDPVDINTKFKVRSGKLEVRNPANTFSYIHTGAAISADRILTYPLLTGTDTLVTEAFAQVLTNKTISAASNTLTGVATQTGTETLTGKTIAYGSNTLTDVASLNTAQTFVTAAKTFNSGLFKLRNPADTFSYTFAGGAITADRTITFPVLTGNDVPVYEAHNQTLINKTIAAASNTLTGVTTPSSTDVFTNKTIDPTSNTIPNTVLFPDQKLIGIWFPIGTATTHGFGIMQNAIVLPTGSTSSIAADGTSGKYRTFTSAATTDNYAGVRFSPDSVIIRNKQCRCKIKFRINNTTNIRFFCGLSTKNANATGDTALDTNINFMLTIPTAATANFQIGYRNTGGSATYVDTGVAKDTAIHTFEVRAPAGDTGFQWSLDGGAFSSTLTTETPGSTANLLSHCYVQTTEGVAKTCDIWYVYVEELP
jgi:hypothetical protein